jgi:hypothetical protein
MINAQFLPPAEHPAKGFRVSRLDAASNLFLPLELQRISSVVNERIYPDLTWAQAFNFVDDPPAPGDSSYAYADGDSAIGTTGTSYADTGSGVSREVRKNTSPIVPITQHYGWTLDQIANAAKVGRPLQPALALACRRAIEEEIDNRAWLGNAGLGIPGFLASTSGINSAQVAAGGAGPRTWASKTADEIIADINSALQTVNTATKGAKSVRPNRLALPSTLYMEIAMRPRASGSDQTILSFLMGTLKAFDPGFEIVDTEKLVGSGTGGTNEFAVYRKDPRVLGHVVAKLYTELPPQEVDYTVKINASAETGGVVVLQPLACGRFRGI